MFKKEPAPQQVPEVVYKLLTIDDFQNSRDKNTYKSFLTTTSPADKDFIHLSTERQYQDIADKYFQKGGVLLKLKTAELGKVVMEENKGQFYPHLYGKIPSGAIDSVREFKEPAELRRGLTLG